MENAHLLRLMGIDRWRLRSAAARAPAPEARLAAAAAPAPPVAQRPHAGAGTVPVEAVTVVCLSVETAMVVVDVPDRRLPVRFCSDLLAALSGVPVPVPAPAQVVFDWPQPGIEPGTGHLGRALAAFLDKQFEDVAPQRLLVCEQIRRRIPDLEWPQGTVVMPELARLMVDGEVKRRLWAQLQTTTAS